MWETQDTNDISAIRDGLDNSTDPSSITSLCDLLDNAGVDSDLVAPIRVKALGLQATAIAMLNRHVG